MPTERRVAWVTGGGRGIGRASAIALARAGCDVALTSRSAEELADAARAVRAEGARALEAPADLTDPARVAAAYAEVSAKFGAPLVLVNAAGVAKSAAFLKTTEAFMDLHWRLNVLGVFHATQLALPAMISAGWGRVVNVASVAGKAGAPYIAAYAASKHAVLGLTRSLAAEYATKGVTVNAVCPGYVDTRLTEETVDVIVERTGLPREAAIERLAAMNPQKRLIAPEEVAAAVAYLASGDARGVNGQALTIDGGAIQW